MEFFFPDSQDLVDPSFDFRTERRAPTRVRHRDDLYAHEVFSEPVADGLLISKGIVDGLSGGAGKYSMAQRHRLLRVGATEFFRLNDVPDGLFERAAERFGRTTTVELAGLLGYYSMLAIAIRIFRLPPEP